MNNNELRKKQEAAEQRVHSFFSSAEGEFVLEFLKDRTGYGVPSFAATSDPVQAAFADGRKAMVHEIMMILKKFSQ